MYEIGRKGPLGPNQNPCDARYQRSHSSSSEERAGTNLDERVPVADGEEVPAREILVSLRRRREAGRNALLEPVEERVGLVLRSEDASESLVGNSTVLELGEHELVVSGQERAARNASVPDPSFSHDVELTNSRIPL